MAALGHIAERCGRWDWCRITRRSGAVFPAVLELPAGVEPATFRLQDGRSTICATEACLPLWAEYLKGSKMATRQTPAATSERVRRKKKGLSCILLGRLFPCRPIYKEVPLGGTVHRLPLRDDATLPRSFGSWSPSFLSIPNSLPPRIQIAGANLLHVDSYTPPASQHPPRCASLANRPGR